MNFLKNELLLQKIIFFMCFFSRNLSLDAFIDPVYSNQSNLPSNLYGSLREILTEIHTNFVNESQINIFLQENILENFEISAILQNSIQISSNESLKKREIHQFAPISIEIQGNLSMINLIFNGNQNDFLLFFDFKENSSFFCQVRKNYFFYIKFLNF